MASRDSLAVTRSTGYSLGAMISRPESQDANPINADADVGMAWRIKASFVDYVSQIAGSTIQTSGGAGVTPGGEYFFALDSQDFHPTNLTGVLKFRGSVDFAAHFGALKLSITDPLISFSEGSGLLSAIVSAGKRQDLCILAPAVPVIDGSTLMFSDVPTFLAPSAEALFNNVYRGGEPFSPVLLRIHSST